MKIRIVLALVLTGITSTIAAKEANRDLAVSSIPATLKNNAHAVLRYDDTELVIKSTDKVLLKRKYAYTILDEEGEEYATFFQRYNLLVKIDEISGRLFDAEGKEISALKTRDIVDRSSYGMNYIFHDDDRIKIYNFDYSTYPYTVAFEVEQTIKTTFFIPSWHTQPGNDCSVESTKFTLSHPPDLNIRFKEYLMPRTTIRAAKMQDGLKTFNWSIDSIGAYKKQPFSKTDNYTSPTLVIASDNFELLAYKGSMQTWQKLGEFIYILNDGRDNLPDDKKAIVKSLIANDTNAYSKIQKLYAYLQQNTRYVANEYGISGWQTFDATNVAKTGYGDCKGLTNYLKALLKEAHIDAYAALVYAGENDFHKLDEDFPSNTFNHVILCVPLPTDTIWIECTSQQLTSGYLGRFTQGRKALLITKSGGQLCHTPAYRKDKNFISRLATLSIDKNATGQNKVSLKNVYSGLMQDDLGSFLKMNPQNKIQEMVNTKLPFSSYDVKSYNYNHTTTKHVPAVQESIEAVVTGIVSSTQKRTFVNVVWMKNPMTEISQIQARTAPFVLNSSFKITDSVLVDLPIGVTLESIPNAIDIEFPFAKFQTRFEKGMDKITMIRSYEQNEGIYEAAEFDKYQKMYRTINASKESMNIVLLNKQ